MKSINELAKEIHQNAKDKGFYDKANVFGERIALMHSELSEALEADRKGRYADLAKFERRLDELVQIERDKKTENIDLDLIFKTAFCENVKDTVADELADTVIRIFDYAAKEGIDIARHIQLKIKYNSMRPKMHGGKKY